MIDERLRGDSGVLLPVRSRPMCCRVIELHDVTPAVRIVRLAIVAGGAFCFAAGQYARVSFAECHPRALSLANRPDIPHLEFHIRHGGADAHAVRHLRTGDIVWVEGPHGHASLRLGHTGPILAIAGGTGLAPLKSIVETALHADPKREIRLYFGARDERHVYLDKHFCRLAERHDNFTWIPVLSHATGASRRRLGMVTDAVAADCGDLRGTKAYIAGPLPMVNAAVALLLANNISRADIHGDAVAAVAEMTAADRESRTPALQLE